MSRSVSVALAASLVLGTLASPAGGHRHKSGSQTRTAWESYVSPAVGSGDVTGVCLRSNGCVVFPLRKKERRISLWIKDGTRVPVYATVGQDTNPNNMVVERVANICGDTRKPLVVKPGIDVWVWLWAAPGLQPRCPGVATAGVVKAKISKHR